MRSTTSNHESKGSGGVGGEGGLIRQTLSLSNTLWLLIDITWLKFVITLNTTAMVINVSAYGLNHYLKDV